MKAETVLKLNGGDIAAAEERCAEWIKAYSAVAEEHPSAEEKAAKLIARAKNALDVIKTRAEAGAEPLYCKDEAYMEQVLAEEEQREAELDGEFPLGSEFDASFANPYFTTENLARIQLGYFNEVRTGVYYEHAEDVLVRQGILHELNGRWKEAERCYNGVSLSGSVLEREYYCRKKAESEGQRLYEKGLELIKNLNWSAAWYPLFAAAELGHSEAMAELGHMTVYGLGCGASADEGLEYLRRAAEAGSDYACRLIWELHDDGAGIVSGAEAERVCEAAAERGYERAKIRLEEGFDTRAYIDILQEDVDAGNVDALWLMANELLENGEEDRAVEYMERAFQAGQIDALMMYGNIYANRNDELFDRAAAAECYKKAAEQGCAEACKALGDLALEEDDEPFWMIERVPENGSKELQLRHRAQFAGYLRAAELGLISAATAVSSAVADDGIVEAPRIVSGGMVGDYMRLAAESELNMHFVSTHFMHPDDMLDPDRGAKEGWAVYRKGLENYLDWLEASAPSIRMQTGTECASAVQRFSGLTVKMRESANEWEFDLGNFKDQAWLLLRANHGTPGRIQGGSMIRMTGNLYLIKATDSTVHVERKAGGAA